MARKIDRSAAEQTCKEIIETILFCLKDAYKGTVYQIGKPPEMTATQITSGEIDEEGRVITWSLPASSDYKPPGKSWLEYRDETDRPLEAMAWCVEKQRSWTVEDPETDGRSVRVQLDGIGKDFHHMEPVLVHKEDLYLDIESGPDYPRNYKGETLWQNSEYIVVAVIKIHFRPNTIRMHSPETIVINRLSRTLGTEFLSYRLRQQSIEAMRKLERDKLSSHNILSDSLRNAVTKSGLIFSLIKLELGHLRDQWEQVLLQHSGQKGMKREAVHFLNDAALSMGDTTTGQVARELIELQNGFLELSLPPEGSENWVRMKVEEKWNEFLHKKPLDEKVTKEIRNGIDQLKRSLYLGRDPDILAAYDKMPESMIGEWVDLIYRNTDHVDFQFLDRLIHILGDPSFNLPYKEKSKKSLIRLKALAEIMGQLEQNTNLVLQEVLNGHRNGITGERMYRSAR
ncbi:MAG: hypothetical protein SV775_08365 [Thermodesulfobacteriota bacterium]|nr:hypothetical protein [Thermodesulfobacteriota bacterium]